MDSLKHILQDKTILVGGGSIGMSFVESIPEIIRVITLLAYLDNDPIEVHKVKLREINSAKQQILIELEALKNESYW